MKQVQQALERLIQQLVLGGVLAAAPQAFQGAVAPEGEDGPGGPCGVRTGGPELGGGGYPLELGEIGPGYDDSGYPLIIPYSRVVANGGSLRRCSSTGINLVGMPPGSMVLGAYLYWAWVSLAAPVPGLHDTVVFGRIPRRAPPAAPPLAIGGVGPLPAGDPFGAAAVTGTLVGVGGDPCWFGGSNFVYRADVTALMRGGRSYVVWLPAGAAGQIDYADPWGVPATVPALCEGATLVVVYTNAIEPMGTTYIYDSGLAGNLFFGTPGLSYTLSGFFHPGTEARWIDVGADGQSGTGYMDIFGAGLETTTFAFAAIAGPGSPYNDSDWNGSANKPLGQLWDTAGHDVTPYLAPGAMAVPITVTAPAAGVPDCLVPVCNVLWVN